MKSDTHEQVNNAVLKWFTRIRAENVPVREERAQSFCCNFSP